MGPCWKKRPKRGWRRELKTILAPLGSVSMSVKAYEEWISLPSLGEGHPQDEDELEGVVEG
jgi:hypothetical protein